jgi:hypothetical protein
VTPPRPEPVHRLDHLFLFCAAGAPELAALTQIGLTADLRRRHQGQGTANVCIGFADGYLELLWLADDQEARLPLVKPLGLHERSRWRETGASPFGLCVRPDAPGTPPPFPTWDYAPAYLPGGLTIAMACNSGVLGEPLLFQVDRPFTAIGGGHALATRRLRQATVGVRDLAPMSLLRDAPAPLLELEFELAGADAARSFDLRPALPLVLRF